MRLIMMTTVIALLNIRPAVAATLSPYIDTLSTHMESGARLPFPDAQRAIAAYVCAQDTSCVDDVQFEACSQSVADQVTDRNSSRNFLGIGQHFAELTELSLHKRGIDAEVFWSAHGVSPRRAALCAEALLKLRRSSGFWEQFQAEEKAGACLTRALAPEFHEAVERDEL